MSIKCYNNKGVSIVNENFFPHRFPICTSDSCIITFMARVPDLSSSNFCVITVREDNSVWGLLYFSIFYSYILWSVSLVLFCGVVDKIMGRLNCVEFHMNAFGTAIFHRDWLWFFSFWFLFICLFMMKDA